ncbi:urease accessory protein UreD [Granulosicoccus antarcticus]|uniref:Urease accessory protein UreD n=1 Tax=Granulosicoccus antarcticus IMCC3135 TaxID=1192854 RepID=A0A2Z2NR71_9GAMM|nr:urease accessory protein UreD [Granulosicoccus antarcticus]ASJ72501.1 Urease accessory protein UreD [Granulosicoccus antarcticus IMCC3135]
MSAAGHVASKRLPQTNDTSQYGLPAIAALDQQGSARIRFPKTTGCALQAVLLNTAGGLTGGDVINWSGTAGSGSRLSISTAACEKLYRTHGPEASQHTQLVIENGARLDWLPQETIIFNDAALKRTLDVELATDSTALLVESLVLGRHAMRESITRLQLHDRWRIHRDGKLLHAEELRLDIQGPTDARKNSMLHHYGAISTVVLVSPDSAESLHIMADAIRELAPSDKQILTAASSVMNHRLVIRVLSDSSQSLRKFLIPCIERLSDSMPIPQVWNV